MSQHTSVFSMSGGLVIAALCSIAIGAAAKSQSTTRPAEEFPPRINKIGIPETIAREIDVAATAAAAAPRDAEKIGRLGMLYFVPAPLSAAECFEAAARLEAGSPRWKYYLALSHAASYRRAEAVAALKEALELEPNAAPFLVRLGDLLVTSEPDAAERYYNKAVSLAPQDARVHFGLGEIARKRGKMDVAEKHYRDALVAFPPFAAAHGALARIMDQQNKFRDARLHRDQEKAGTPPPPVGDVLYVELLAASSGGPQIMELVESLDAAGRIDAAIALLEGVTRRDPTDATAHHACGMLHGKRGNFPRAAAHFRAVLDKHPGQLESVLALGQAYSRMGAAAAAQQLVQEVINHDADNVAALAVGGSMLLERGQAEQARVFLEKLVKLQPASASDRLHLAACLICLGKFSEALVHYKAAKDSMPDGAELDAEFIGRLARLMADQRRFGVAAGPGIALLGRAVMMDLASHFQTAGLDRESETTRHYVKHIARLAAGHARTGDFEQAEYFIMAALEGSDSSSTAELIAALKSEAAPVSDGTSKNDKTAIDEAALARTRVRHTLALALALSGDHSGAIAEWESICKTQPDFEFSYLSWAEVLAKSGRHRESLAVLRRAREQTQDAPLVLNGLAWLLATCPDGELRSGGEAVKLATLACQRTNHENPELLDTLATAYAAAGEYDKAVATAQEAVRIANDLGMGAAAAAYKERLRRFELKVPYEGQ